MQGMAPADLPPGPFDLVLLSEVGYFLTPLELRGHPAPVRGFARAGR